jgi:hypothetical protein
VVKTGADVSSGPLNGHAVASNMSVADTGRTSFPHAHTSCENRVAPANMVRRVVALEMFHVDNG